MANALKPEVLRSLAKMGAQARLELLEMERRAILQMFPELAPPRRGRKPGRPRAEAAQTVAAPVARRRRRHTMTAAQRKEVSVRMKRYWAARRAAKGK